MWAQWVATDLMLLHANSEDSIILGGCPGWSESSLGAYVILFVFSCLGSNEFHMFLMLAGNQCVHPESHPDILQQNQRCSHSTIIIS